METERVQIGIRQIRTSGQGSGSIEVTLPTELRDFVGLPCRVLLRDGRQPHIVLQPEVQPARAAFERLWCLAIGALLPHRDDLTSMPDGTFAFGLHPQSGVGDLPLLSWRDGLALASPPPHAGAAVSRALAAMVEALAPELEIDPSLARGFGMASAYLAVGIFPSAESQEICEVVADALRDALRPGSAFAAAATDKTDGALGEAYWRLATPILQVAVALFKSWSANSDQLSALRVAWRRGVSIEMNGG